MAILFKTYNGRHQLHIFKENWLIDDAAKLKKLMLLFDKQNAELAKITPVDQKISINLHNMIVECRDVKDTIAKFAMLAEYKDAFQPLNNIPVPEKKDNRQKQFNQQNRFQQNQADASRPQSIKTPVEMHKHIGAESPKIKAQPIAPMAPPNLESGKKAAKQAEKQLDAKEPPEKKETKKKKSKKAD